MGKRDPAGLGRSRLGRPLARTEMKAVLTVLPTHAPALDPAVDAEELHAHEGLLTAPLHELPMTW